MKTVKRVTYTKLVEDYLRNQSGPLFATADTLRTVLHVPDYAITKTLHYLRGHKVLDCLYADGALHWYALPPEQDTRIRVMQERAEEGKGARGPRKPKATVKSPSPRD